MIVSVKGNRSQPVWECAADDDSRMALLAAHIERVDDEHVRVTCANGFALASVVYPAEVPAGFTSADIPAELLKWAAEASPSTDCTCLQCEEDHELHEATSIPIPLTLDTEQRVAEIEVNGFTVRAPFVLQISRGFPDYRALTLKSMDAWSDKATPELGLDTELLGKAARAIGYGRMSIMRLPAKPMQPILLLGHDGAFALVMPMQITADTAARFKEVAALGGVQQEAPAHREDVNP